MLRDLCATNSVSSSESNRIIAESLEFILKDKFGNDAKFPENCFVVCRLSRVSFDKMNYTTETLARNTPQFMESVIVPAAGGTGGGSGRRAGGSGVDQLTSVPMTQYNQSFPQIQLLPSDELIGGDGRVEVIFEVQSKGQQGSRECCQAIEKFAFSFQFTTDEDRALKERQFREEILPYHQQLEHLLEEQRKGETEYEHVQQQLREIARRANGLHLGEYLSTSQLTQSDVRLLFLYLSPPLPSLFFSFSLSSSLSFSLSTVAEV
jgi:hypothetical protein